MYTEKEIQYLKATINLSRVNPEWIKAFEYWNKRNTTQLKVTCRQCYYKVLQYIIHETKKHNTGNGKPKRGDR
jgi:hypothetical protein